MSDTSLVLVNLDQLPSTQVGTDDQFNDLAKSADYIGRLQLFTKGKAVNKGQVRPGHYGIPEGEEVIDLGDTIDIVPLAKRPKALDMSDMDAIITKYDPEDAEFKRIKAESLEKDSHCMFGISFLVYERSTARFGVLLWLQEHAERGEAHSSVLPPDPGRHRPSGCRGQRCQRSGPAWPRAVDPEESVGGKAVLLLARAGGREVLDAVHEAAVDGPDREGNQRLPHLQG